MIKRILRDILPELPRALAVATIIALIVATLVEGLYTVTDPFDTRVTFSLSQLAKLTLIFDITFLILLVLIRGARIWYYMDLVDYEQTTKPFRWLAEWFWLIFLVVLIVACLALLGVLLFLLY
jgi:hypothetical protein